MRSISSNAIHSVRIARFNTEVKAMSEGISLLLKQAARFLGLLFALVRQVNIGPTREQVFFVPDALSMPK